MGIQVGQPFMYRVPWDKREEPYYHEVLVPLEARHFGEDVGTFCGFHAEKCEIRLHPVFEGIWSGSCKHRYILMSAETPEQERKCWGDNVPPLFEGMGEKT